MIFDFRDMTLSPMEQPQRAFVPRALRVDFPVLVSFACDSYTVREFSLNLSEEDAIKKLDRALPKVEVPEEA